jgi:predicted DNA-binding ribbon-helix-helix protein
MNFVDFAKISVEGTKLERIILVDGHPVEVRMCAGVWAALTEIAALESMKLDELVAQIARRRSPGAPLEPLARIAALSYWKRMR